MGTQPISVSNLQYRLDPPFILVNIFHEGGKPPFESMGILFSNLDSRFNNLVRGISAAASPGSEGDQPTHGLGTA